MRSSTGSSLTCASPAGPTSTEVDLSDTGFVSLIMPDHATWPRKPL